MSRALQSILTVIASGLVAGLVAWGVVAVSAPPTGSTGTPPTSVADGLDGQDGADGLDGRDGADGQDGAPGAPGPRGLAGERGAAGAVGPAGPAGPQGPVGPQGEPGVAGPQGPAGDTGPAGPAGQPPTSIVVEVAEALPFTVYPTVMIEAPVVPAGRYLATVGVARVLAYTNAVSLPATYDCNFAVSNGLAIGGFSLPMTTTPGGIIAGRDDVNYPAASASGYIETTSPQNVRVECGVNDTEAATFTIFWDARLVLTPISVGP